jgi:glycosyltransferase involved in cell wall biosynthesis
MHPATPPRLLLLSGLSVTRVNSFSVQLDLLARTFTRLGCECRLYGTVPTGAPFETVSVESVLQDKGPHRDLALHTTEHLAPVVADFEPEAIILLGYPDQFPFLGTPPQTSELQRAPRFLWAQFSRPPRSLPRGVIIVPLTEKSGEFARSTAVSLRSIERPIPHGVDLSCFRLLDETTQREARMRFALPETAFIVGYVGTNQRRKRHDRLLDSFALIHERRRDTHLVIKTDRAHAPSAFDLGALIRDRGLETSVTIIGAPLASRDIGRLVGCMDLYLHVSEWEGFGLPFVEALASGVPVATHRGQGPGEITPFDELLVDAKQVVDESGAVLEFVDPDSAAAVACRVIDLSREARAELSVKARNCATEQYDIEVVARRWINLISRYTSCR